MVRLCDGAMVRWCDGATDPVSIYVTPTDLHKSRLGALHRAPRHRPLRSFPFLPFLLPFRPAHPHSLMIAPFTMRFTPCTGPLALLPTLLLSLVLGLSSSQPVLARTATVNKAVSKGADSTFLPGGYIIEFHDESQMKSAAAGHGNHKRTEVSLLRFFCFCLGSSLSSNEERWAGRRESGARPSARRYLVTSRQAPALDCRRCILATPK